MQAQIDISIIIPVYNSEEVVYETVQKTYEELNKHGVSFEIILVNDGSPDQSWGQLVQAKQDLDNVVIVNLLRNYGQHSAVFCGIQHAQGSYLVTMDDDLQNPPSELMTLYNKIQEGYDLVFAKFRNKQHAYYRKLGTRVVDFLNRKVFHKPAHVHLTNFRIFTKEVAKRVGNHQTFHPYIPGLLLMYSSSIANVETEHHPRKVGRSNYSTWKIVKLVSRILFNYTTFPLHLIITVGGTISVISFLLSIYYVLNALFVGSSVEGWTTVAVMISFFNGLILLIFGILGQYVIRMMKQISNPAPYIIKSLERSNGS